MVKTRSACTMFDVHLSNQTPYGINATCERLQNNLALMPLKGSSVIEKEEQYTKRWTADGEAKIQAHPFVIGFHFIFLLRRSCVFC